MLTTDMEKICTAATNKAEVLQKRPLAFFMRAVMAGFFIVVAVLLSNVTGAVLYAKYPEAGKVLSSALFPIAIILIVFIGGDLFTGNNMTMALGVYSKKCSWMDLIKVWIVSYIGNFIGAFVLTTIFYFSGSARDLMTTYYQAIIPGKLSLDITQLILRGILCNFLVCLAVWTGTRLKSESGKLIIMILVIMTFVISGFEHCIANMSTFTLACYLCPELTTAGLIAKNMLWVTLGNVIGGAVLFSGTLKLMTWDK